MEETAATETQAAPNEAAEVQAQENRAEVSQAVTDTAQEPAAPETPTDELYASEEPEAEQAPVEPEPVVYDFDGVTAESGEITQTDIDTIRSLSEELKLSNEQARDLLAKSDKYVTANLKAKQTQVITGWIDSIKTDPVLGGSNFKTTQANLARVMKRYGGDGAYKFLSESGLGAHPAIVKMLNAIGRDLGEEQRFVNSKSQAPKPRNKLRSIYNNSPDLNFGD